MHRIAILCEGFIKCLMACFTLIIWDGDGAKVGLRGVLTKLEGMTKRTCCVLVRVGKK